MGALLRQRIVDNLQDGLGLREHLVIPEAQHGKSLRSQVRVAVRVVDRLLMLSAVDFHNEPALQTDEIEDVGAHGVLTAESTAVDLTHPQASP